MKNQDCLVETEVILCKGYGFRLSLDVNLGWSLFQKEKVSLWTVRRIRKECDSNRGLL
jgi:hypothetical protein